MMNLKKMLPEGRKGLGVTGAENPMTGTVEENQKRFDNLVLDFVEPTFNDLINELSKLSSEDIKDFEARMKEKANDQHTHNTVDVNGLSEVVLQAQTAAGNCNQAAERANIAAGEIDQKIKTKADLVNGTLPSSQLPKNINAATLCGESAESFANAQHSHKYSIMQNHEEYSHPQVAVVTLGGNIIKDATISAYGVYDWCDDLSEGILNVKVETFNIGVDTGIKIKIPVPSVFFTKKINFLSAPVFNVTAFNDSETSKANSLFAVVEDVSTIPTGYINISLKKQYSNLITKDVKLSDGLACSFALVFTLGSAV